MKKLYLIIFLLLVFTAFDALCDYSELDTPFALKLTPNLTVPLGADSSENYKLGTGGEFSLMYSLKPWPILNFRALLGYSFVPVNYHSSMDKTFLSLINFGLGTGLNFRLLKSGKLLLGVFFNGGYAFGMLNESQGTGSGPFIETGVNIGYQFNPSLSLGMETAYRNFIELSNDIAFSIGLTFHLGAKSRRMETVRPLIPIQTLELSKIEFDNVFPVFFKYYDEHPLGTAVVRNTGTETVEGVKITLYVKQYMDDPKACGFIDSLAPGEEKEIELFALFTDSVLQISEATKVSAKLTVETQKGNDIYGNEYSQTIRLYDRNAITWEDDRRAAAFVTMKDPTVLTFSKNIAGIIKDEASNAINSNLLTALAMYETLMLYGLNYVVDPSTPYVEFSEDVKSVDYLQFPIQTLEYKAGDCDDLSILYCALLESVGIETAFITVPGHIFMGLTLNMEAEDAYSQFLKPEDLIFIDEKTWLPVEVTALKSGFLTAWQEGARLWREYSSGEHAAFYPMNECWELYEPVGFSSESIDMDMPDNSEILNTFIQVVNKFVDKEIYPRVESLQELITQNPNNIRPVHSLALLYAKYGIFDKAIANFNKILSIQEHVPSLINMGNIYYLQNDMDTALEYYERAYKLAEDNPIVILCMARVQHALENYSYARRYYDKLKVLDPETAERFTYLELKGDDATRAANINSTLEVVVWDE